MCGGGWGCHVLGVGGGSGWKQVSAQELFMSDVMDDNALSSIQACVCLCVCVCRERERARERERGYEDTYGLMTPCSNIFRRAYKCINVYRV